MKQQRIMASLTVVACLAILGCHATDPKSSPSALERYQAYFQECPKGRDVRTIEIDLDLPAPTETNAPASDWPLWKMKYVTDDVVLGFLADLPEDLQKVPVTSEGFYYVGDPWVETHDAYEEDFRRLFAERFAPPGVPTPPASEMENALDQLERERRSQ